MKPECYYKDGVDGGDTPYQPDDNNWHPYDANREMYGDRPVEGVDWCDAWAYCYYAGKDLCGDADGNPVDQSDPNWATSSEWYRACHADEPWPDASTCFQGAGANDVDKSRDVDDGCDGKDGKLENMTSNVWEWENNCKTMGSDPALDECPFRGDPNPSNGAPAPCDWYNTSGSPRNAGNAGNHIGIRCCWKAHQQ